MKEHIDEIERGPKHTELPWVCAEDSQPRPEIATVCRVGSWVVGVSTPGYPGGDYRNIDCEDPAGSTDAAFIVEACNSHASLVDSLAAREAECRVKAVALASLVEQRDRMREALTKAREWIPHDWECKLHVLQWDENERKGISRRGEKCTCDLKNKEAFIDAALAEKVSP